MCMYIYLYMIIYRCVMCWWFQRFCWFDFLTWAGKIIQLDKRVFLLRKWVENHYLDPTRYKNSWFDGDEMTYSGEFLKQVSDGNSTLSWMDSWKNWGNQPTMGGFTWWNTICGCMAWVIHAGFFQNDRLTLICQIQYAANRRILSEASI